MSDMDVTIRREEFGEALSRSMSVFPPEAWTDFLTLLDWMRSLGYEYLEAAKEAAFIWGLKELRDRGQLPCSHERAWLEARRILFVHGYVDEGQMGSLRWKADTDDDDGPDK